MAWEVPSSHPNFGSPLLPPAESSPSAPAPASSAPASEALVVGLAYSLTFVVGGLTASLCGPGCHYVEFTCMAVVSGGLMLRRALRTRLVCLAVLLISIAGMWHEKETRETWTHLHQRRELDELQRQLDFLSLHGRLPLPAKH